VGCKAAFMKKLIRVIPGPVSLSNSSYETHSWKKFNGKKKKKPIWSELMKMQGGFCCYCESSAVSDNGHIEHFFYKGEINGVAPYKEKTFEWSNLFGCCGSSGHPHCGHFKDKEGVDGPGKYNPYDLIKPDEDDPSNYFHFIATGHIRINENLSSTDKHRAEETVRVLNLSAETLNSARKTQINIVKKEVLVLLDSTDDMVTVRDELKIIKSKARDCVFQTAVISALILYFL
jgi:uncharacterized protein (TIGR02646 family)